MALTDWQFVFKRRKWRLENYISDCITVQDALDKFTNAGMTPPSTKLLISHGLNDKAASPLSPKAKSAPVEKKVHVNKPVVKAANRSTSKDAKKQKDKGYDDIVIIETPE